MVCVCFAAIVITLHFISIVNGETVTATGDTLELSGVSSSTESYNLHTLAHQSKCPPGLITVYGNHTPQYECKCRSWALPDNILKCGKDTNSSLLRQGYCLTGTVKEKNTLVLSKCYVMSKHYHKKQAIPDRYISLPNNVSDLEETICGPLNRQGILCHKCKPGHGISFSSATLYCTKCTWNLASRVFLYLTVEFIPATLFHILILYSGVNLTAPPFNVCVFFCQMVGYYINANHFFAGVLTENSDSILDKVYYRLLTAILSVYEIWNLDFFRYVIEPFCVFETTAYYIWKISIDFMRGLYPLVLILFTYLFIKLHDRSTLTTRLCTNVRKRAFCNRETKNISFINLFSSFFLLSYSKILISILDFVKPTQVYTLFSNGSTTMTLHNYYDPGMSITGFLRTKIGHKVVVLSATVVTTIILHIPLVLLIIYQTKCFQKCISFGKLTHRHCIRTFAESFQGHYKNGLNGTWDMRFVSGGYLLLRGLLIVNLMYLPDYELGRYILPLIITALLTPASLFYGVVQPYVKKSMNICDCLLLAVLQVLNFLSAQLTQPHPNKLQNGVIILYLTVMLLLSSIPLVLGIVCLVIKIIRAVRTVCACFVQRQYIVGKCYIRSKKDESLPEQPVDSCRTTSSSY